MTIRTKIIAYVIVVVAVIGLIILALVASGGAGVFTTPASVANAQGLCINANLKVTKTSRTSCLANPGNEWYADTPEGVAFALSKYGGLNIISSASPEIVPVAPHADVPGGISSDSTKVWSCERSSGQRELLTTQNQALDCVGQDFTTCTYANRGAFDLNQPEYCTTRIRQFKLKYNLP